jgi:hypothetical protein
MWGKLVHIQVHLEILALMAAQQGANTKFWLVLDWDFKGERKLFI